MELYTADYIDWLKENYPDADHTKDAIVDFEAQEANKRVYSSVRSTHVAIARGDEDSYDQVRENGSWSEISRLIRG